MMDVRIANTADLFVTDLVGQSNLVRNLCAKVPHIWVTDADFPPGHFGSYFGATPLRRGCYENPYIQDLYFLHEIEHITLFRYGTWKTWLEWQRNMIRSEVAISVLTECLVYWEIPGLREQTFPHEIWMDRFLSDQALCHLGTTEERYYFLKQKRMRALMTPDPTDFLESQIHGYRDQNITWCAQWGLNIHGLPCKKGAWRLVEEHMAETPATMVNLTRHLEWLKRVSIEKDIPFPNQAEAFRTVFEAGKARFGNHVLMS